MKIKSLKTYQSVLFQNSQMSFFADNLANLKDMGLEMQTCEWGIEIKSKKDHVIVGYNNVAYAKPLEESIQAEEPKKAKKQ